MEASIKRNISADDPDHPAPRVLNDLRRFSRDVEFLASKIEELTKQYPDELVEISDCAVVAHSHKASNVLESVKNMGIRGDAAVVEFLATNPDAMIFVGD